MTTATVADLWRTKDSVDWGYFRTAEGEKTPPFWREDWPFLKLFRTLDLSATLEIACGQGRHAAHCVDQCGTLHLLDTSIDAIATVRQRFAAKRNVHVHLAEGGSDLLFLNDATLTTVYSYDAMVHFEVETMAAYLREIGRVLKVGGKALLHHSNSSDEGLRPLTSATGWRNYMTADLFAHLAFRGGLEVVDRAVLNWSRAGSDALTLLINRGSAHA